MVSKGKSLLAGVKVFGTVKYFLKVDERLYHGCLKGTEYIFNSLSV